MRRRGARRGGKFPIVVLLLLAATYGWYRIQLHPADASDKNLRTITVSSGMGVGQIADSLAEKDIIKSTTAFKAYVFLHGLRGGLKAGSYSLSPSLSVQAIVQSLSTGTVDDVVVTIPEGYTVRDIDALFAKRGIAAAGVISECARTCDFSSFAFLPEAKNLAERGGVIEGYLFPDTYNVRPSNFDAKAFLSRMLENFDAKVLKTLDGDMHASPRSLSQIVTMASLIEEETRTDAERPLVSGILWRRYDEGYILGVDAAVRYITGSGALTAQDLQVDSPYNIRKVRGLPPGPITNPGLKSIKAALHPETSEYLYYLHDGNGQIHYARTNDEHNENKRKYLQ